MRMCVLTSSRFCIRSFLSTSQVIKTEPQIRSFHLLFGHQCRIPIRDGKNVPENKLLCSRKYAKGNTINCWSCHQPHNISLIGTKESFFCSSCGSLQEINRNYNYFSLFGMVENFQIDQNDLTKKFRQFQSVLHPDKFSNKNETEQNLSAEVSSLINEAYKTLSTPAKRAEYILRMKGITIAEDNNAVDKDFLLEIMERNEEVDEASDSVELKSLLKRVQIDMNETVNDFDLHLKGNNLDGAKSSLILLRYYLSLENSIKTKLIKLEVAN